MKLKTFTLNYILPAAMAFCLSATAWSQCDPMSPEECPDPENNGQICPDTLPMGYLNQPYSEVATILVPEQDTNGIPLHHITLVAVDNLPSGVTWVSNSPDSVFMAGNYYCILMEGTPAVADTFYLKIVVDIYINFFGQPVFAMQVTDSTSLAMIIVDNTGMKEKAPTLEITGNFPNPFTIWTSVRFLAGDPGEVWFEVYSILGEQLHRQKIYARPGENYFHYYGENLGAGAYFYVLRSGELSVSRMMVKGETAGR